MLQAGRIITGHRACCHSVHFYISSWKQNLVQPCRSNFSTSSIVQKSQAAEQLCTIKKGGKKKRKSTAMISAEDNETFKELKGRVRALKARELNILTGNLEKDPSVVGNPAQILNLRPVSFRPLHPCSSCGREFKTKRGLKVHTCKVHEQEVVHPVDVVEPVAVAEEEQCRVPERHGHQKSTAVLASYFDLYVTNGKVDEAYEHFKSLRLDKSYKAVIDSLNIEVYNILMRGFARKFDFPKIQELWKDIITRNLQPDLDSYISSMIALGNADPSKNIFKVIYKQIYTEFLHKNYTIDEALTMGRFDGEDRKLFLRSIDYLSDTPRNQNLAPEPPYSNPLLENLPSTSALLQSQTKDVVDRNTLGDLFHRQMRYEIQGRVKVESIVKEKFAVPELLKTFTRDLEEEWKAMLVKTLEKKRKIKARQAAQFKNKSINLYLFFSCLPVDTVADIILKAARELCQDSDSYSLSSKAFINKLGAEFIDNYIFYSKYLKNKEFNDEFPNVYSRYLDWYADPAVGERTHRAAMLRACCDFRFEEGDKAWPDEIKYMLGKELKQILLKEIFITRDKNGDVVVKNQVLVDGKLEPPKLPLSSNPAFFKVFRVRKEARQQEETKPHPSLSKLYTNTIMQEIVFNSTELPMVCPPKPWLSTRTGSFLYRSPGLVRISENLVSDQLEKLEKLSGGEMNPVIDSINQLSSIPWKVNKAVFNLVKEVFNGKCDPGLFNILGLPLHPDSISPPESIKRSDSSDSDISVGNLEDFKQQQLEKAAFNQFKRESYSQWCDTVYRLSIAQHFMNDVLWFPHNMDFRGRVYPVPPYLNHMGADLSRSLLVFAQGKPLGDAGFRWLKLHCINLTGLKKRESVEDRLQYADDIMHLILDSAENPLTGKRWFLESDEPWQTFAACVEIKNALENPEGPEKYICHLPIHQDGSCNGLQHYAAIGRDKLGAAAVNLVPADKPQDVYSEIATIVEAKRREDAENGVEVAQVLDGFVRRKVVKQTVMTTVYGVTHYGATKQIARQLKDISDFPAEFVSAGSKYLGVKTFESLNELFTASQEIQDWLTECAKVISSDCNLNVEWTTPLGLPVVQPYTAMVPVQSRHITVDTKPNLSMQRVLKERKPKVMTQKHRNGFPPNFIHSLDASHMMLTSLYLWHQGISFASVHDCYWTHACDVATMNETCRDQFISLHSYPILEDLSTFFLQRYLRIPLSAKTKKMEAKFKQKHPNVPSPVEIEIKKRETLFKNVPKKGDLDLNVVKDSVYFFS